MYEKISDDIKDILADKLGIDKEKIGLESRLVDDLGADSLDQVEVMMALEEKYGIDISDPDAEKITTVKHMFDYINSKL